MEPPRQQSPDWDRRKIARHVAVYVGLASAVAVVHAGGPAVSTPSPASSVGPIILTETVFDPGVDEGDDAAARPGGGELPDGSRIVAVYPCDGGGRAKSLTDGFAAAGRADVSFDGSRILFVARRERGEKNAVWEMGLSDGEVRQVVAPPAGCNTAIYLSTLYTLDSEQPNRELMAFCSPASAAGPNQLFTCRTDGSNVQQITFAPGGVSDPYLLRDGRLLFSMGLPADSPAATESPRVNRAFFTINVDGTEVFPFAGVGEASAWRGRPCESSDGWVYYLESGPTPSRKGRSVVAVRRTRSLHTRRVVASSDHGEFNSVSSLEDGRLLVSHRPGEGRDPSSYDVYILDPNNGERSRLIVDEPTRHRVDAVALRPRPVPHGRSSIVKPGAEYGQLYCLDVNLSDGADGAKASDRAITGVRVLSTIAGGGVLGTASVESDGSFFVEAPARTPLRLETVDSQGEVVRTMRSWMWLMPMEHRGCIGCHEDRELAPPNRHVLALRKAPQRIGMGNGPGSPQDGGKP